MYLNLTGKPTLFQSLTKPAIRFSWSIWRIALMSAPSFMFELMKEHYPKIKETGITLGSVLNLDKL
jgi:hypothetical protein